MWNSLFVSYGSSQGQNTQEKQCKDFKDRWGGSGPQWPESVAAATASCWILKQSV